MIRLTDLAGNGSFTMGGKKFEYGKVYSNPYATAFKPVNEAEGEDHEVSMGQNQLDTIIKMATELKAKMGEDEKQIPAWIQDHISKAENYISQAAGNYHEYGTNESVNEAFEVHYSDGIRAAKKFGNERQAVQFAKDLIKNKKGLKFVDVFNTSGGFHSTADTDKIVAWWGKGSYTDNKSKSDSKLAKKKIEESVVSEAGPCWKGYKQVGMKDKNGKQVPNCVPEGVVTEAGVNKMYVKYLAVQKKVAELVAAQLKMKDKYFAETDAKKKAAMMPALKKGTEQLQMWRRNLQKIEDKYVMNLDKDTEYTGEF